MFPQPKRRKKDLSESDFHPFPIDNITLDPDYKFSGYFTGINVEIFDAESIKAIYENGSFGIGSKTQAAPKVLWKGNIAPSKVLKKIYDKKCEWREQIGGCDSNTSIEIISDTSKADNPESDINNMPAEIILISANAENSENAGKATVQIDPFHIEETLVLTLEESFFLHNTLKCLQIMAVNGKEMQTSDILMKYCSLKPHFWTHFVAYSYLKSKNWIVKCGLKFGGDFRKYYYLWKCLKCVIRSFFLTNYVEV